MAAWRGASAAASLAAVAVAIKVLLFPAYHSTDFEVHRNWLAITHSLPIKDWYTWSLSPWTLDYPPLFAYFECALSSLAAMVDSEIVRLDNLDYASWSVVCFQRGSVLLCELPLLWIAYTLVKKGGGGERGGGWGEGAQLEEEAVGGGVDGEVGVVEKRPEGKGKANAPTNATAEANATPEALPSPLLSPPQTRVHCANIQTGLALLSLASVALSPGLLLVDHVHFQYNGPLLALLAASLWALAEGRDALGGALFAALICFKHLFLYPAPFVFVHLLSRTALQGPRRARRFSALAGAVLAVFALAFAPLAAFGGLPALAALAGRLFPFDRGLLHTYWAPNAWALYAGVDAAGPKVALAAKGALMARGAAAFRRLFGGQSALVSNRLLGLLSAGGSSLARFSPRLVSPSPSRSASVSSSSFTGGILGASAFAVLPPVGSRAAALCTLAAQAPCLAATLRSGAPPREAPFAALHAALAAFCFGYHVHEKAILPVAVPGVLFALWARDARRLRTHLALSALGFYALLPLVHRPEDRLLRLALYALPIAGWIAAAKALVIWDSQWHADKGNEGDEGEEEKGNVEGNEGDERNERKGDEHQTLHERERELKPVTATNSKSSSLAFLQPALTLSSYPLPLAVLLAGLPALELACSWILPFFLGQRLPFLPLMATSLYCGAGVVGIWAAEAWAYAKAAWRGGASRGLGRLESAS